MPKLQTVLESVDTPLRTMSLAVAKEKAPAIFATKPAEYIKSAYNFTPTTELIGHLDAMGWKLTNAKQSHSKVALRQNYGIHITEFQHQDLYIKQQDDNTKIEARPTIVLINSHDGTKPLTFEMGLFRLVCSNGLIIKDRDFGGFRERHTKMNLQAVKELIDQKVSVLPNTVEKINQWTMREMSPKERKQFALDALLLRISDDRKPEDYELMDILMPRRKEDEPNNLWCTYNIVQENLLKGGFQFNDRKARAITNPVQDLVLNQDLWQLADTYAGAVLA